MPIALTCPKCHASQTIPDEATGQTVECPGCRTAFQATPTTPTPLFTPEKTHVWPWIIGIVLLAGAGLAAYQFFGRSTATDFTEPNNLFSARFPNPPEIKEVSKAEPLRLVWGQQLYQAKAGGKEYSVAVFDGLNSGNQPYGPATRDAHINSIITITLTNASGEKLTERAATHEGHPAKEIVLFQREEKKLTALRILAGERHVLRLAVTGSGDKDKPTEFLDQAGEFFNGVHIGTGFGSPIVEDPPTVSATELAAAYKTDAKAADAKYKNHWLRVTGSVREVSQDGKEFLMNAGEDAVLVRRAPRARMTVQVRPSDATIATTGKCRGLESGTAVGPRVVLEDAIVASPPPK